MQRAFHATVKPFIGGLNTELTQAEETPQYTADELNFRTLPDATRGRRYGMGVETDGDVMYSDNNISYSIFFWGNANNAGIDLLAIQKGETLVFKKALKPYSSQPTLATIDLSPYIIDSAGYIDNLMRYTTGGGKLIVANKYMTTLLIQYDQFSESVSVTVPNFKVRDFDGLEEDIAVDYRPTTLSVSHNYNLLNQGWAQSQITQFHTDIGDNTYPSNNLVWFVGKDNNGSFDVTTLMQKYFGNTPAPKGHFLLDAISKDRSDLTGITGNQKPVNYSKELFGGSYGSGNKKRGQVWKEKDGNRQGYIDVKNNPGILTYVDLTFEASKEHRKPNKTSVYPAGMRFRIQGFNRTTKAFEDVVAWRGVTCDANGYFRLSEQVNNNVYYSYIRIWVNAGTQPGTTKPQEIRRCSFRGATIVKESGVKKPAASYDQISDVNFLAGHFFYQLNNRVLFSQTVTENITNFDKCYQDADPTSETVMDIVDTDGGELVFTALGDARGLAKSTIGMLVFGSKATYAIISNVAGNFSATNYNTQFINNAGCLTAGSIVETEGAIYYWSPVGIMRISENLTTGISLVTDCVSTETIQTFYHNIPDVCKNRCRGVYDAVNRKIYWYYPETVTDIEGDDGDVDFYLSKYNRVLVYDLRYNSFHPYKLAEGGWVLAPFITDVSNTLIPESLLFAGDAIVVADTDEVIAKELEQTFTENTQLCHLSKMEQPVDSYYLNTEIRYVDGYRVYSNETKQSISKDGVNWTEGSVIPFNLSQETTMTANSSVSTYYNGYVGTTGQVVMNGIKFDIDMVEDAFANENLDGDAWYNIGDLTENALPSRLLETTFNFTTHVYPDTGETGDYTVKYELQAKTDDGSWINLISDEAVSQDVTQDNSITLTVSPTDWPGLDETYQDFRWHVTVVGRKFGFVADDVSWSMIRPQDTTEDRLAYTEYNSRDFIDWQKNDYDSYVISFPLIATDTISYKQTPIVQTIFTRTEEATLKDGKHLAPSGCKYRTRWSWSVGDESNRWDMMQNCYFVPENYDSFKYLTTKIVVRGWGKAFQIELRNDENKDLRIAGINTLVRGE